MAELIGTTTFNGVISLYKLIQSFRHHPKPARDLMQGVEDLQGVTLKLNSRPYGSIKPGALLERVVNESLQECSHNLTVASSKLETHMRDTIHRMVTKSKMAMTSKEEIADVARIWDELETTFKRKEMFSKAESRLNENISVIENYGNGDARQIMVSTDGNRSRSEAA
ncbi:hypothetical protein VF21_01578 [Pseudogymnoascus sp. 05NY08]|nr:hypothetical protein VF21_01578 [Pseudogymnoascus sp. 05NY08]